MTPGLKAGLSMTGTSLLLVSAVIGTAALGHLNRMLTLRAPNAAPVALNVGDVVTVGGQQFKVSATLAPDSSAPVPPPPPPPPPVNGWIDQWRNSRRDFILAAAEGDLVYLDGGGFGSTQGSVILDSTIKAPVVSWSNSEIAITLPHVAGMPHVPLVQVLSPAGTVLATQNNGAITINPK